MKKELKKEFKTNQAIEKLKNLNCEVIDIYEKGYVVYISFPLTTIDSLSKPNPYKNLHNLTDLHLNLFNIYSLFILRTSYIFI